MTTFDINDTFAEATTRPARENALVRWFRAWHRRRQTRITLAELYRMDPHLLRDMGIAPRDVIDALEGRDSSILFNPVRRPE